MAFIKGKYKDNLVMDEVKMKNKEQIDVVFVVLIYRTAKDLVDFIASVKRTATYKYRVIVVNSFYDESSLLSIRSIVQSLGCDFLPVENKGYGYGNNRGIEFALNKYEFDFLIISNADVEIKKFDYDKLSRHEKAVYGTNIITDSGKRQNPYWAKEYKVAERWIYEGLKYSKKYKLRIAQAVNRLRREIFLLMNSNRKTPKKVFAIHGSFVIFQKEVFEIIGLPYDEKMFLFSEEACIAHKLKDVNIKTYYLPQCKVQHHEDGSTKGTNINVKAHASVSVVYYYENYVIRRPSYKKPSTN